MYGTDSTEQVENYIFVVRILPSLLFNEMSKRRLLFHRGISAYRLLSLSLYVLKAVIFMPFCSFRFHALEK